MRLKCIHGHFRFFETAVGQISDFISYSGFSIVPENDHYTFKSIADAPLYSIAGAPYLSSVATKTFEGMPWDVFRANGFVYDFTKDMVVPISSITVISRLAQVGNRFVADGLLLPGTIIGAQKVSGFDAWFSRDRLKWLYSEVSFV